MKTNPGSRYPHPLFTDKPKSPYSVGGFSDQMWVMGYWDGVDNDPACGPQWPIYREGFAAGRKAAEHYEDKEGT